MAAWAQTAPASATGTSEDGPAEAYRRAQAAFEELDLPRALAILDAALGASAAQGHALERAALLAFKAGVLHAQDAAPQEAVANLLHEAVRLDPYIEVPIEMRTPELAAMLEQARSGVARPPPGVRLEVSPAQAGEPLRIAARLDLELPPRATAVLYWRPASGGNYQARPLEIFGHAAHAELEPEAHGDRNLEVFVVVFDDGRSPLAQVGSAAAPSRVVFPGSAEPPAVGSATVGETPPRPRTHAASAPLPRWFLHLGVGMGFGVAAGTVERTYAPMLPGAEAYGPAEQACALERWAAGGGPIAGNRDTFAQRLQGLAQADPAILPLPLDVLANAYRPDACAARLRVKARPALAPLHVVPEVGVRVSRTVVLSVFSRLQLVTAGSVRSAPDPTGRAAQAFATEARSPEPRGASVGLSAPGFTFAIGAKVRAFLPSAVARIRPFAGGFAGYGFSRLRVSLPISHDRNGNSVPDASETAVSGSRDAGGQIIPATCVPVWPYNDACQADAAGMADRDLAAAVRDQTSASERRVDTLRLGPGFIGGLVGMHIDLVPHLALWAELDVGVWFPHNTSVLFDLTLGPVVTF